MDYWSWYKTKPTIFKILVYKKYVIVREKVRDGWFNNSQHAVYGDT